MGIQDKYSSRKSPTRTVAKPKLQQQCETGGHVIKAKHFTMALDGTSSNDRLMIIQMASDNQIRDMNAFKKKKTFQEEDMFDAKDMQDVFRFLYNEKAIELDNKLGAGNYSEVYVGKNMRKRNKKVAVKIIKMSDAKRSRNYQVNFLQNELNIIAKLRHPRIIRTYSLCQVANKVIVVMEFASRGTMSDIVTQYGALVELTACKFFREMIRGLAFMHLQHSVAHRDLKLENILITENNIPKLADFSFSVVFDGHTLCEQYCGTPPYFAPELFKKVPYNPLLSDMWSIGVCLFIMTNDKYPFGPFDKPDEMLQLQLERKFTFREKIMVKYSSYYKPLVRRLLEPEPELRYDVRDVLTSRWVTSCPQ